MKALFQKIRRAGRLLYNFIFTNKTRVLTIRVILLSAWFHLRLLTVPMARLEKTFGTAGQESSFEEDIANLRYAHLVGARVERVCKKTSWDAKCLVQALIAQRLLRQKGIHTTLYLGLRKENEALHAHAWLRCGRLSVTGGYGNDHTVVSTFYC